MTVREKIIALGQPATPVDMELADAIDAALRQVAEERKQRLDLRNYIVNALPPLGGVATPEPEVTDAMRKAVVALAEKYGSNLTVEQHCEIYLEMHAAKGGDAT